MFYIMWLVPQKKFKKRKYIQSIRKKWRKTIKGQTTEEIQVTKHVCGQMFNLNQEKRKLKWNTVRMIKKIKDWGSSAVLNNRGNRCACTPLDGIKKLYIHSIEHNVAIKNFKVHDNNYYYNCR